MLIHQSSASSEEIDEYTTGQCHVLAVALNRMFGWQIEVVRQEDEIWWQDEEDADNFIPAVLHVYAVDAKDNAWDISGVRPYSRVNEECQEAFHAFEVSGDTCRNEGELSTYVGMMEDQDIELPLSSYTDEDVQEAMALANRVFQGLPGYGEPLNRVAAPAGSRLAP